MVRHGNHSPYRIYKNQKNQIGSSHRSIALRHAATREGIVLRVFYFFTTNIYGLRYYPQIPTQHYRFFPFPNNSDSAKNRLSETKAN